MYFRRVKDHPAVQADIMTENRENLSIQPMDKYDYLLLDVIQTHKQQFGNTMKLSEIEDCFWKRIESDQSLNIGQARIGERVTNLYVNDLIQNKDGYSLTRRGREVLSFAPMESLSVAS